MRLIDADNLQFNGRNYNKSQMNAILDFVDAQPTTYDPDKVVEQLEEVLSLADKEKERCARENPLQFDSAKGYATGMFNALEIVKAGGVNA